MTTASMMRRTEEFGDVRCVAIVQTAYAAPSQERDAGDRQEHAQAG